MASAWGSAPVCFGGLFHYAKENSLSAWVSCRASRTVGVLWQEMRAWGGSIADVVEEVCVLDFHGKPGIFSRNELDFRIDGRI
jgi:hypothetical protein